MPPIRRFIAVMCCGLAAAAATTPRGGHAAPMYEVIPLQQLESSTALAVNDLGQVAGYGTVIGGIGGTQYRALRWSRDGVRTQLATTDSRALDINNAGQTLVSGAGQQLYTYPMSGPPRFIVDYGTLEIPASSGSLNSAGDAGVVTTVQGGSYYWFAGSGGGSGGTMILPSTIGFRPEGITRDGTLYGSGVASNLPALATPNGIERTYTLPAPFISGLARGANDAGEIIGTAQTATTNSHGFLIDRDGDFYEFPSPLSGYGTIAPQAINADGDVVGFATATDGRPILPFLLQDGVLHELNDLVPATYTIYRVTDISDTGYILATAQLTGLAGAGPILLRPVPEPSCLPGGALALFLLRRTRKAIRA